MKFLIVLALFATCVASFQMPSAGYKYTRKSANQQPSYANEPLVEQLSMLDLAAMYDGQIRNLGESAQSSGGTTNRPLRPTIPRARRDVESEHLSNIDHGNTTIPDISLQIGSLSNNDSISLHESDLGDYLPRLLYPPREACMAASDFHLFSTSVGSSGHVTYANDRMFYHPTMRPLDPDVPEEYKSGSNLLFTWAGARSYCRNLCMEPISVETLLDYYALTQNFAYGDLPYVWTSGRRCANNSSCAAVEALQPLHQNGWFWVNSGSPIPTDFRLNPFADLIWSHSTAEHSSASFARNRQPDNAARGAGITDELCVLASQYRYEQKPTLHDHPCLARAYVICQSSPFLCSQYGIDC